MLYTGVNDEDNLIAFNNCTTHNDSSVRGLWFVVYTRTVYVTMI